MASPICHLFSYQNLLQIVDDKSNKSKHSKKIHLANQNPATVEVEVIGKSTGPNCRRNKSNHPNPDETPLPPTLETVILKNGESGAQGGVGVVHGGGVDGAENGNEGG